VGFKVVFTDYYYPNNDQEIKILNQLEDVQIIDCTKIKKGGFKKEKDFIDYVKDADAIIVQAAKISKKIIEKLTKCKIICRYAIGVDNIDVEEAKKRNIIVANVPDYCIEEVSNTAIALLFYCLRKIGIANHSLRKNMWSYNEIYPIHRLSTLTLGLIAFGNIAKRVAEKMRPFGCEIISYDPYFHDGLNKYSWVKFVSLKKLLNLSDIISLHAPLTKETFHLINKEAIECMKNGSIIVNTARGGLIDEKSLVYGIETGKISLAGLDATSLDNTKEKYRESLLSKYPKKIFVTPHMAWHSEESIEELQKKVALNVYSCLKNGNPLYKV